MLTAALTGNAASGKSTVAAIWRDAGVPVLDADQIARDVVAPGTPGLREVTQAFGTRVLRDDGSLDRDRVRALVFADPAARARLEAITHPRIRARRDEWLGEQRRLGSRLAAAEIPLLFEAGMEGEFDVVVLVDAPESVRTDRLVRDRGLPRAQAEQILRAQQPTVAKRARADVIVDNSGSVGDLRVRALAVLASLRERAGAEEPSLGPAMRVDMHLHTSASYDCLSDPHAVLERAEGLGLTRICITDHNQIAAALQLAAEAPDRIIPGEEVRTAEGIDVIGLYLHEAIPKGTPAREVCDRVHAQGGIVYVPHPFASGKGGSGRHLDRLLGHVDAVEVHNARLHSASLNERAAAWAARHNVMGGAGSDAHTLGEIGTAFVECPAHPNQPAAFVAALKSGRIHGRTSPRRVHVASTWAKLRKWVDRA